MTTDVVSPLSAALQTDGAAHTFEQGQGGGARNQSSASNNYDVVKQECNVTRFTGTTEAAIATAPAYLLGVIVNNGGTPSAGYATIRDAAVVGGGATPKFDLDTVDALDYDLKATRFEVGICVDGSDAATDVSILWRPIG